MIYTFLICIACILVQGGFAFLATFRHFRQPTSKIAIQNFGILTIWLFLISPVVAMAGLIENAFREYGGNMALYFRVLEASPDLLYPLDLQYPLICGILMFSMISAFCLSVLGVLVALFWQSDLWYWQSIVAFCASWPAQFLAVFFYIPYD